jgi:hypothetical protein
MKTNNSNYYDSYDKCYDDSPNFAHDIKRQIFGINSDIEQTVLEDIENGLLHSKNVPIGPKTLAKLTHVYRLYKDMCENFYVSDYLQKRISSELLKAKQESEEICEQLHKDQEIKPEDWVKPVTI